MRVVFSDPNHPIAGIWKQGDHYSVSIGGIGEPKAWHALKGEAIAESVAPPPGFVTCDPNDLKGPLNEFNVDWRDEQRLWKSFAGDKMIFAASPVEIKDNRASTYGRAGFCPYNSPTLQLPPPSPLLMAGGSSLASTAAWSASTSLPEKSDISGFPPTGPTRHSVLSPFSTRFSSRARRSSPK